MNNIILIRGYHGVKCKKVITYVAYAYLSIYISRCMETVAMFGCTNKKLTVTRETILL